MSMKQFVRYMIKTPLRVKMQHVDTYCTLNRQLNNYHQDYMDALHAMDQAWLINDGACRVCFHLVYPNGGQLQSGDDGVSQIIRCPDLNSDNECVCARPCLCKIQNQKCINAQAQQRALLERVENFWADILAQVR